MKIIFFCHGRTYMYISQDGKPRVIKSVSFRMVKLLTESLNYLIFMSDLKQKDFIKPIKKIKIYFEF